MVSNGWLLWWKIRNGICQINMEGEAKSGDINAASEFPSQLQNMIEKVGCCDEHVYNCDETALYYKLLPAKSLNVKKDAHRTGFKLNEDRVMLLLCTNKTGSHKLTTVHWEPALFQTCKYELAPSDLRKQF
jgi:hypothetical protein